MKNAEFLALPFEQWLQIFIAIFVQLDDSFLGMEMSYSQWYFNRKKRIDGRKPHKFLGQEILFLNGTEDLLCKLNFSKKIKYTINTSPKYIENF